MLCLSPSESALGLPTFSKDSWSGWRQIGRQAEFLASGRGSVEDVVGSLLKELSHFQQLEVGTGELDAWGQDACEDLQETEAEERRWRASHDELFDEFMLANKRVAELQESSERVRAERCVVDAANSELTKEIERHNAQLAVALHDIQALQRETDVLLSGPTPHATTLRSVRAEADRLEKSASFWKSPPSNAAGQASAGLGSADSPFTRSGLLQGSSSGPLLRRNMFPMEHTSSPKASPGARCVSPSPSARSSVGAKRSSRPGPSRTVPSTPVRTPPAPVGDLPENELASSTLHSASIEMRPCQKGTTLKTKDGSTGSARHTPSRLQRALCKMPPVTARTVTPATVRTRPVSLSPSPKREAPSLLQTRSMEDLFDTGFVAGTAGTQRGAASVSVRGRFQSSGFPCRPTLPQTLCQGPPPVQVHAPVDRDEGMQPPQTAPKGTPPRSRGVRGKDSFLQVPKKPTRLRSKTESTASTASTEDLSTAVSCENANEM